MDFSKNLQKLRKSASLSQEALADILGVSRQTISKWETGEARPLTEHIFALTRALNCRLGDLLGEAPEKGTMPKSPEPPVVATPKTPRLHILALSAMSTITLVGLIVATNLCATTSPAASPTTAQAPFDFAGQELLGYGVAEDTGTPYLKFKLPTNDSLNNTRVAIVYLCPDGSYRCDYPDDPEFLPAGEFHPAKT